MIDIVRNGALIEIQTGPVGPLAKKLDRLLDRFDVTVIHPIAVRTWLHKPDAPARRSPIRRTGHHVFEELVSFPTLIEHPRFTFQALLIEEDRHREHDPTLRRRRGGWRTMDRQLRNVVDVVSIAATEDLVPLIPSGLPAPFTTADLAKAAKIPRRLAQQMAYCLRAVSLIGEEGRTRSGVEYRLIDRRD